MPQQVSPERLLAEMSQAHHDIREIMQRFDDLSERADRAALAEELCTVMARHRSSCTDAVLRLAAADAQDHEQQVRLLLSAYRGIDRLVDRLRLPARDPYLLGNLLEALRTLVQEHERLELEMVMVALDTTEADRPPEPQARSHRPARPQPALTGAT